MVNASSSIKETVLEYANERYSIPRPLLKVIGFLENSNIFLAYHINKIKNPRAEALVGTALYYGPWLFGASDEFKLAIYIKCGLDCLKQYEKLDEAWVNLKQSTKFMYPTYRKVNVNLSKSKTSPGFAIWWNGTVKKNKDQIFKIISCAWRVFCELCNCSLVGRDLYMLTKGDPSIEFFAYTNLANDAAKYGASIKGNLKKIAEQLESHEGMGNRLMKKLGWEKNVAVLVSDLGKKFAKYEVHIDEQIKGFSEDFKMVEGKGDIDLTEGLGKPNILPKCRFMPWSGKEEKEVVVVEEEVVAVPELDPSTTSVVVEPVQPATPVAPAKQNNYGYFSSPVAVLKKINSVTTSFVKSLSAPSVVASLDADSDL